MTTYSPLTSAVPSQNVVAKFSEPVVGVTNATFKVRKKGTTKALAAVISMSADRKKATLNPSATLQRGKQYIVKLTSGIKDDKGNPLVTKSWTFSVS